jgi:methylisocitrate lyase
MLYSSETPTSKREAFRRAMTSDVVTVLPGAFNALTARMVQRHGYQGIYVSGHMIAADLGLPDLGLTTITEVATRGAQLSRVVDIPAIIDADTGFGEPMNAARSVQSLEDAGLAGCHIEDQVNPKKCGHSEGVAVVDRDLAMRRVRAAVAARRDPAFTIIARTDARAVVGLEETIGRALAFVDAGADAVFPEALTSEREYETFRNAVDVPLFINLNEFGRGTPLTVQQAADLGYDVALYPMTLMRLAMGAAEVGLRELSLNGHQHGILDMMQTKEELYELLGYDEYERFDNRIFSSSMLSSPPTRSSRRRVQ